MITIHPKYVIDENDQKSAVLLPVAEWERVVEDLEELDDIRTYDAVKSMPHDSVPFEQAVREIQEGCEE
jgi:PHD/YefM family antitoxin component YafN of YafNO toxin-antitoxin module